MIQLDKTGVVGICHAMVACDNQVYLKWVDHKNTMEIYLDPSVVT